MPAELRLASDVAQKLFFRAAVRERPQSKNRASNALASTPGSTAREISPQAWPRLIASRWSTIVSAVAERVAGADGNDDEDGADGPP